MGKWCARTIYLYLFYCVEQSLCSILMEDWKASKRTSGDVERLPAQTDEDD
jgi:hypothetical protein